MNNQEKAIHLHQILFDNEIDFDDVCVIAEAIWDLFNDGEMPNVELEELNPRAPY